MASASPAADARMSDATEFPFDLVMFDLDGTLVETVSELCDAVNDTLAGLGLGLGLAPVLESDVRGWIGNGTGALLLRALAHVTGQEVDQVRGSDLLARAEQSFVPVYARRCGTSSQLVPHALELLRRWHGRGIRLAVVTNKDRHFAGLLLDHHGLSPWLHRVIGGDMVARKKPAPDGLLDCLAHFGVAAERALFIGDSSIDVATARNASVRVWARDGGYNQGQPITASQPDRVFRDFAELLAP